MIATTFKAMGTSWWIHCDLAPLLAPAEALVRDLEDRLSRFRDTSALSRLNRQRELSCPVLADVTRRALELQAATGGAFDPTLGAELAALGYDRTFASLGRRARPGEPASSPDAAASIGIMRTPTTVVIEGDRVRLDGPGALDLGGIAKGYAVDRVVELLVDRGATSVLVDGGGDLRGFGPCFPIGVGDGLVIASHLGAVATSSTLERRWLGHDADLVHHLLDPTTGRPSRTALDTATVVAPDTATADALATALIVGPDKVLPRLAALGAHALARTLDGRWWTTPGAPFAAPLTSIFPTHLEALSPADARAARATHAESRGRGGAA